MRSTISASPSPITICSTTVVIGIDRGEARRFPEPTIGKHVAVVLEPHEPGDPGHRQIDLMQRGPHQVDERAGRGGKQHDHPGRNQGGGEDALVLREPCDLLARHDRRHRAPSAAHRLLDLALRLGERVLRGRLADQCRLHRRRHDLAHRRPLRDARPPSTSMSSRKDAVVASTRLSPKLSISLRYCGSCHSDVRLAPVRL